jgi:hypothetical protein
MVLLVVKLWFETTTPGKLLDGMLYCWVQTRLSVADPKLPVVVVDISNLDATPRPGRLTPRAQLEKLIDRIVERSPAAIGIDIDFSPHDKEPDKGWTESGWTERGGPQFFDHIRQLRTPIYLGVDRRRYGGPADWLGAEDYQNLAVNIVVPRDDNRQMPLWIRRGSGRCSWMAADLLGVQPDAGGSQQDAASGEKVSCLPAMGLALAQKSPDRQLHAVHWPSSLLRRHREELMYKQDNIYAGFFYPDYSVARYLQEQTSTAVVSDSDLQLALNSNVADLRGKLVLLGNTAWEKSPDKYPIPPWQKEAAGVYFHACAAYTLLKGPLLEITEAARTALDLLLTGVILLSVSWLRLYYSGRTHDEVASHRVHFMLTSLAIIVVLIVGYGLVQYTRILWTDSLLVSLALIPDSLLERHLGKWGNWVRVAAPKILRWVLFDKRKER